MSDNSSSSSSNSSSSLSSSSSSSNSSLATSYISPYSSLSIPACINQLEDNANSPASASTSATQFQQQQQSEMIFFSQNQEHRRSFQSEIEPSFSNIAGHMKAPHQFSKIKSKSVSDLKLQPHNHSSTCDMICSESCRKEKIESALDWLKKQEDFRDRGY